MTQPQAPTPPPHRPRRKWRFILLGGFVTLPIVAGCGSTATTSPSDTTAAPTSAMAAPAGPATTIDPGTYVVGKDVQAGSYRTTGPSDSSLPNCYWARLKDTSGDATAVIANGLPGGPTTVTISKSDGAFQTMGCATWKKTS